MSATVAVQQTQETSPTNLPRIVANTMAYILEHVADDITLSDLAQLAGMSDSSFCRSFTRACGLPPMRWLWNFRVAFAAEFMAFDPSWSVTDVAFACGFTSSAHFSRAFRAAFAMSPLAYRKNKAAEAQALKTRRSSTFVFDQQNDLALLAAGKVWMQRFAAPQASH